ncbi:MAG TPA: hypothetical protein DCY74_05800, partial [Clostridiales bacterium]|nr:hypothetical protein [Clostridiales bacterium]
MFKDVFCLFLTAHLLGDFYLQTKTLAEKKNKQFCYVVYHALIYALASMLCMLPFCSVILCSVFTGLSVCHFIVDTIKYCIIKTSRFIMKPTIYLVDQAIHLVLIAMGAFFFVSWGKTLTMVLVLDRFLIPLTDNPMAIFRWIGAVLFIHKPTNITIKGLLMGSRAQSDMEQNQKQIGAYIGTLERIVILFFFSIDEFSAIGFVLTAKS